MTDFAANASAETKAYWGSNPGAPWIANHSHGLVNGNTNILSMPCSKIQKMVPYFKEFEEFNRDEAMGKYKDVDALLYDHLNVLGRTDIDYGNRSFDENPEVAALPDAVYRVYEANSNTLHYDSRVNDHHIWQYHKGNGLSKIILRTEHLDVQVLRINEGQMEVAAIINAAYIKNNFNTTVVSGVNYYPFRFNIDHLINRFMSFFT